MKIAQPLIEAGIALANVLPGDDAEIKRSAERLVSTALAWYNHTFGGEPASGQVITDTDIDLEALRNNLQPQVEWTYPPVQLTTGEAADMYLTLVQHNGLLETNDDPLLLMHRYTGIAQWNALQTFLGQREVVTFKWDYLGDEVDQLDLIGGFVQTLMAEPELQQYYPEDVKESLRKYRFFTRFLEHVLIRKIPRHHPVLVRHCKQFNEDWAAYFINQGQDPEDENPLLEIEVLPVATFYIAKESNGNEYVVTGQQMTSALMPIPE